MVEKYSKVFNKLEKKWVRLMLKNHLDILGSFSEKLATLERFCEVNRVEFLQHLPFSETYDFYGEEKQRLIWPLLADNTVETGMLADWAVRVYERVRPEASFEGRKTRYQQDLSDAQHRDKFIKLKLEDANTEKYAHNGYAYFNL
jgi:hypothetical protein